MADSMEEVNAGGKKHRKWHVCCAVLRYISYAKLSQIFEVLRDWHRLSVSRNSPTTGILHTIRHVYRSMWPAREAKPRSGVTRERSTHDCETRLYLNCLAFYHISLRVRGFMISDQNDAHSCGQEYGIHCCQLGDHDFLIFSFWYLESACHSISTGAISTNETH